LDRHDLGERLTPGASPGITQRVKLIDKNGTERLIKP